MAAKRGKDVGSGKMSLPNGTIAELRTARDQLYNDMGKDPTTQVPWTFVQLLEKVNMMVDGQHPAKNNGMEKVLYAREHRQGGLKHLIGQFLVQNVGTLDYNAVFNAFPGSPHGYIKQCLSEYKHGKLELPSTDGIKYKVSGGMAMIIVSPVGKEPSMLGKIKSNKKTDRTLFCLYHNPGASDKDIAAYVGFDEKQAARMITKLISDGYVEKRSRKLTGPGLAYVVTLEQGATNEPLLPRFKAYLVANEGKDVGIEDVLAALPGERRSLLNNYLGFFARGQYRIDGYNISRVDGRKLHIEKTAAPQHIMVVAK